MSRVSFFFFSFLSLFGEQKMSRDKKGSFVAFSTCNDGCCRCKFGEKGINFVSGKRLVDRNEAWKKRTIVHRRRKKKAMTVASEVKSFVLGNEDTANLTLLNGV